MATLALILLLFSWLPVQAEVTIYDKVACKSYAADSVKFHSLLRYWGCINEGYTLDQLDEFAKVPREKLINKDETFNPDIINHWIREHEKKK